MTISKAGLSKKFAQFYIFFGICNYLCHVVFGDLLPNVYVIYDLSNF
jgi:hypothetical protein